MAITKDKIVVVDIEATCWNVEPPPDGQLNEIIEIGICTYDIKSTELEDKRSIFVHPVASVVSEFCTQLTTITQTQVDTLGIDFATACDTLQKDYQTRNRLWTSWGSYDHKMFRQQCKQMGIKYPFSDSHMNLKRVYADLHDKQRMGMARALDNSGLGLIGIHHRGDDDAWNIARILKFLIKERGQDILLRYW